MRKSIKKYLFILDPVFALFALLGFAGLIAKRFAVFSDRVLPLTRYIFKKLGYLPVRDHYYEPVTFSAEGFKYRDRLCELLFSGQKDFTFLASIATPDEFIKEYRNGYIEEAGFKFGNGTFESGDAEVLFYFIRHFKPKKIVEIGAGNSSLIIYAALKLNVAEGSHGEHIIIEPYENPWLEKLGPKVIRQRVEEVDFSIFHTLQPSDLVFIDSSHVVRAQNDCVFEYTELLPSLPAGVVVHIHDIFTPFDYPEDWLNRLFHLWGEQYVLEALLANSSSWQILAPLCWLSRDAEKFKSFCPYFESHRVPGSFWIQKIN